MSWGIFRSSSMIISLGILLLRQSPVSPTGIVAMPVNRPTHRERHSVKTWGASTLRNSAVGTDLRKLIFVGVSRSSLQRYHIGSLQRGLHRRMRPRGVMYHFGVLVHVGFRNYRSLCLSIHPCILLTLWIRRAPSETRRWEPSVENPRMGGVSKGGSQRHASDLSDAFDIGARDPNLFCVILTFWSVLEFRFHGGDPISVSSVSSVVLAAPGGC